LQLLLVLWVVGAHCGWGGAVFGLPTRDLFDHLWLHRWASSSLAAGESLLRTDLIAWPEGGLLLHPDPLGGLVYGGLSRLMGAVPAYDGLLAVQLWLACLSAWALGRQVSGSALAGWFCGLSFGLSAFLLGQAAGGETETLAVWPLVLALFFLERTARSQRWRDALAAGALGALCAISCWYYGAFFALYLLAWGALRQRSRFFLGALGAFLLLVAAPAWLYHGMLHRPDNLFQGPDMATYLADHPTALAGMVADPAGWLGFFADMSQAAGHPRVNYLGSVLVLLALAGVWAGRGGRAWWIGVVVVALALSLGPRLHLGGQPLQLGGRSLPGPYALLCALPLLGLMRIPQRWTLLAALGLSLLAALGLRHLAGDDQPAPGAKGPQLARLPIFVAGASALLLADLLLFAHLPWGGQLLASSQDPARAVAAPAISAVLPGQGAVLDLPPRVLGDDARGRYLVWQQGHGRPVPYSLLMTGMSNALAAEPLVAAVAALDSLDPVGRRPQDAQQFRRGDFALAVVEFQQGRSGERDLAGSERRLRKLGIDAVVLHSHLLAGQDAEAILGLLERQLGVPELVRDGASAWHLADSSGPSAFSGGEGGPAREAAP